MTELLQLAIAEIEKLPVEEQNAIAIGILAELKDEQSWKKAGKFVFKPQPDSLIIL